MKMYTYLEFLESIYYEFEPFMQLAVIIEVIIVYTFNEPSTRRMVQRDEQ